MKENGIKNNDISNRKKWNIKPWSASSTVILSDGSTRPYDYSIDFIEHIACPLSEYVSNGLQKAVWKPEYNTYIENNNIKCIVDK